MKRILIALVILGLMVTSGAVAKDFKIGYIDMLKVFNEYQKTKDYDKKLEVKKQEEEKKLNKKKEDIEKMQNKLSLLKEEEQEKEREKILKIARDYRDLERKIFVDLKKQRDEKMKEIIDDISAVAEEYAEKGKFDMILNAGGVLYGAQGLDVSDQILKLVNDRYNKKK